MRQGLPATHVGAAGGALGVALLTAYLTMLAPHPAHAATPPPHRTASAAAPPATRLPQMAVTVTTTTRLPTPAAPGPAVQGTEHGTKHQPKTDPGKGHKHSRHHGH